MPGRVVFICVGWLCLAWVVTPGLVYATTLQGAKNKARMLYRQGEQLTRSGKFQLAAQRYLRAVQVLKEAARKTNNRQERESLRKSQAAFYYIIARTYDFDKQPIKAIRYYRRSLALGPKPGVERQARKFLALALASVQVALSLRSVPSGARVTVTNAQQQGRLGRTPVRMDVEPGTYMVVVSKDGFKSVRVRLQLAPSARVQKTFRLKKNILPPVWRGGVQTAPVARVPVQRREPGTASGLFGKTSPPNPAWMKTAAYAMTGAAVGGFGLGAILVGIGGANMGAARDMKGNALHTTEDLINKVDEANGQISAGVVFFVLGGLTAVAAVAFFVLESRREAPGNRRSPTLSSPPASSAVLMFRLGK